MSFDGALGVGGKLSDQQLHLREVALGEERSNRPVNQTGDQGFVFRGALLAFEIAAGNATGGVELLAIVDG